MESLSGSKSYRNRNDIELSENEREEIKVNNVREQIVSDGSVDNHEKDRSVKITWK